ncbi:MAG: tetratricopeptide repeat protein [Alphaproteobacteria bacterium]|nr:tetratricopeptide repeat protein [Alphaproteobacteria bacterium]
MSDPRLAMALKYRGAGLDAEAWQVLASVLAESAPPSAALELAAAITFDAGDFATAIDFCNRVIAVDPARDQPHVERALALEAAGRLADAETGFRTALALNPRHARAWASLGGILDRLGRPADAIAAFRKALALAPDFHVARNNLGAVLAGQGSYAAAAREFNTVLDSDPGHAAAAINLAVADVERGHAQAGYARLAGLASSPERDDNLLFSLHNISSDPIELATVHRRPATVKIDTARRIGPGPLKVGYVSGDFRRHSAAFFIEPLLRHHDRRTVQVTCYANVASPDAVTERLRAIADTWRDIRGLATDRVAELVRRDGIDVLVDLAGRTQDHRLDVFLQCPAPIQITGIGYPGTTGLDVFDGRLADAVTDPPAHDAFSAEPVVRLPGGMHCFQPPSDAPALKDSRDGDLVFGSFNKLAKLSEATVALWSRVLAALPTAKLMIKAKALVEDDTRADVSARFARHGIATERLNLVGWQADDRDHLASYRQVDIGLDTFPYNGTTTTCEALWMGVPVVTMMGRTHASRVGASLLTCVGMTDWIATDEDAFVACAVAAGRDRTRLRHLRAGLRARVAASPLCDGARHAREVEAAYQRLCAPLRGS